MSQEKVEVRDPEVNVALVKQQEELNCLQETTDRVLEKMKPVLRDEPIGDDEEEKEQQSNVPLVVELESKTKKIQLVRIRLQRLLNLCEL